MSPEAATTILVVEDSAIQAELLRRTVAAAGYAVLVARDGAQGLAMAKAHRPTAVISDVTMPVMDGFEMCSRLRQDPDLRDTPVILLTALSDARDVMHGLNAGADCYVTKPYLGPYLLARLAELLVDPPPRDEAALALSVKIHGVASEILAPPTQILKLLVMTYESAILQNRELVAAQDALERSNVQLEDKVRARTTELECSNAELTQEIHRRRSLEEQLRELSLLDPLTGLYNRRLLQDALEREAARARRSGLPLGIVMLDIDHFKHINDQHGHAGGDLVLKWLGRFLLDSVRGEDIACRYGGEEFTLLVPGASLENTAARAEQIRRGVQAGSMLEFNGEQIGPITLSLGVAVFHADDVGQTGVVDALHAADAALYRAKQQGRNQTVRANAMEASDPLPTSLARRPLPAQNERPTRTLS